MNFLQHNGSIPYLHICLGIAIGVLGFWLYSKFYSGGRSVQAPLVNPKANLKEVVRDQVSASAPPSKPAEAPTGTYQGTNSPTAPAGQMKTPSAGAMLFETFIRPDDLQHLYPMHTGGAPIQVIEEEEEDVPPFQPEDVLSS